MASIIDRLLGRTEPEPVKAVTGPGAFAMTYHTPLHSFSRDPHRLMAEAQSLYRSNVWVNAAERTISNRLVSRPWHLEDEAGETVTDKSPEDQRAVLQLLRRPSHNLTRRQLWRITSRHLGLCGNAFWYLDQRDALAGTPLSVLYINPARMTPATDAAGNVTGWTLDHPDNAAVNARTTDLSRRGVPLSVDEVIHFTFDDPDWGVWGIGIAESAQRKLELTKLADAHVGSVLASGGRLTGLIAPKEGGHIEDDHWQQFARDWRSITSDPDAAKRLQIAKMPLDFTQMTYTPEEMQLVEVSKGNRDDILGAWGVPPSQTGIMEARGLNSGETVKYEEAALFQGAIQPRGDTIQEMVQVKLLDRYAALGTMLTHVVEWPEFDDEAPLYDNASKAKIIPLTVDQRLEMVGRDPLDPKVYGDFGQAIFVDQTMVRVDPNKPEEPAPIPFGGKPPTLVPDDEEMATDEETEVVEGKADLSKPLLGLRAKTQTTWEPKIQRAVQKVLSEQQADIARRVTKYHGALSKKPADQSVWWNEDREAKRLAAVLEPLAADLATEVNLRTSAMVKKPGKADTILERILDYVRKTVGERIAGINQTTREKVQAAIEQGVTEGMGPQELGTLVSESAAFDDYRAEMIARTETMNAYNDSALRSYAELDVAEVQAIDGDKDPECADRDGKVYTIAEAEGIADHPNGTLDWVPVVKATLPEDPLLLALKALQDREPPTFNITVPERAVTVNVPTAEAPKVEVNVPKAAPPVVNVKAAMPAEVRIVGLPDRMKRASRNAKGEIDGMVETDG